MAAIVVVVIQQQKPARSEMPIRTLSDRQLLDEVARAVMNERLSTIRLIRLLAEIEERDLHFSQGYSSMFAYCTGALKLSEHAAYGRITAARTSRRFPQLITFLERGDITLTTIVLLAPHVTEDNAADLIEAARFKSKDQVARLIAAAFPRPDVESSVRRVPAVAQSAIADEVVAPMTGADQAGATAASPLAPTHDESIPSSGASLLRTSRVDVVKRGTATPLSAESYLIRVTVSAEAHENLRHAQDLLRHTIPDGDPAAVIERALAALVAQLERTRLAKVDRPRPPRTARLRSSRHIPASVKREVWKRDAGRCAFVGPHGRCGATGFLEFHHVKPFAAGGLTIADNLSLRCRAHNGYEARLFAGEGPARDRPR